MEIFEAYEVTQVADFETNINVCRYRCRMRNGYEVVVTEKPLRAEFHVKVYDSYGNSNGVFDDQDENEVLAILESVALHEDNKVISDEALDDLMYM